MLDVRAPRSLVFTNPRLNHDTNRHLLRIQASEKDTSRAPNLAWMHLFPMLS